jgi:uncharacterized protein (DUF1778 family)
VSVPPPRIGMDRYVDADWMELAAGVVRGEMDVSGLHARLASDIPGVQVRRKTLGIINTMWFPADPSARDLVAEAARIAQADRDTRAAAFEAVAIAAYPYFRQVIENLGRLLRLQETCSPGEVHRRMFEQHGKRSTIDQATSYGFKTLVSWGMVQRQPDKRLARAAPLRLGADAKRLLDAAANRSRRSVSELPATDPLLFAFQA